MSSSSEQPTLLTRLLSPLSTRRARQQAAFFFAGAACFFFTTGVTSRALKYRRLAAIPRRFTPSTEANRNFSGPGEAFQALTLASLNVGGAGLMLTGGALWAFDISSLDDMRRKVRGGMGVDDAGKTEGDAEEEFEEWVASVLSRKEKKEAERQRRGEEEKD